ncbi:MAG: hypothetical protein WCI51_10000 [Lentisphaerota bacterium]
MNSKERVRATIAKQPVDRVPLGFYLVDHDTISKVIGRPTYLRNRVAQKIAYAEKVLNKRLINSSTAKNHLTSKTNSLKISS